MTQTAGIRGESLPGSTTNFGEGKHNAPHFALVAESIFTNDFELGVSVIWGVSGIPSTLAETSSCSSGRDQTHRRAASNAVYRS